MKNLCLVSGGRRKNCLEQKTKCKNDIYFTEMVNGIKIGQKIKQLTEEYSSEILLFFSVPCTPSPELPYADEFRNN